MKQKVVHLFERFGAILGLVFSFAPIGMKKAMVQFLLITRRLPPQVANLAAAFAIPFVKAMTKGVPPLLLTAHFPEGFHMELDATQKTQRELLFRRQYEMHVANYIRKALTKRGFFIDIGAHVGYYSLLARTLVGPEGKVISIEAANENVERLQKNIALNTHGHVTVFHCALSDHTGEAKLYHNPLNDGGHSLNEFREFHDSEEVWDRSRVTSAFPNAVLEETVTVITLDELLKEAGVHVPPHAVIKVDVEHLEARVLRGMSHILSGDMPLTVVCEVTANNAEVVSFMRERGFSVSFFGPHGLKRIAGDSLPSGNFLFTR